MCTNQPLAALHNDELLLWGGPGKDDLRVIPQDIVDLLLTQILQVGAVDHTCFGVPSHTERRALSSAVIDHYSYVLFSHKHRLPGVHLADGDVKTSCNVFHRFIALGDDPHSFCNSFGCDWMISGNHNDLVIAETRPNNQSWDPRGTGLISCVSKDISP